MKRETIAIHGGFACDPATKAVAVPIYQTAAYAFDSAEHGAALFNLEVPGYRYTRISNPTTDILEQRVTELEGGVGSLSVSSGQTALYYAGLNATEMGRNIVSVPQLYGTTYTLFAHILPRMGVQVRFAKSDRAADLEALIDNNTRAIFCETVGNPAGNVCDLEALAAVAHRHHMPLIVDNTVATPMLVRPVDYGADIVIHSLTKFIGGCRSVYQRTVGAVLSPMNAFLLLQGIETVALRVERHVENARKVAEFLRNDPRVDWINYAGFTDSPCYPLVEKYLNGNASSLFTFGIKGGLEAGKVFYDSLELITRLVNIGDAKSLACHPASTTHRQMTAEQQPVAGILPETIRLSIGIEHVDDIIEDIDQALAKACSAHKRLEAAE